MLQDVGDHDLAAVGGILRELLLLIAAMDGLSEPEPLIAAAAGEAEAAQERRFEEIGYGEVEPQALGVETRRHRGKVYASVPPGGSGEGPEGLQGQQGDAFFVGAAPKP